MCLVEGGEWGWCRWRTVDVKIRRAADRAAGMMKSFLQGCALLLRLRLCWGGKSYAESVEGVARDSLIHRRGGDQLALSNKLLMIMPTPNLLTWPRTTGESRVMMSWVLEVVRCSISYFFSLSFSFLSDYTETFNVKQSLLGEAGWPPGLRNNYLRFHCYQKHC